MPAHTPVADRLLLQESPIYSPIYRPVQLIPATIGGSDIWERRYPSGARETSHPPKSRLTNVSRASSVQSSSLPVPPQYVHVTASWALSLTMITPFPIKLFLLGQFYGNWTRKAGQGAIPITDQTPILSPLNVRPRRASGPPRSRQRPIATPSRLSFSVSPGVSGHARSRSSTPGWSTRAFSADCRALPVG